MRATLEVVVATVADAVAAEAGGADRLELVANLVEGGITPSAGVIAATRKATRLPIYIMIRPRGGSFHFSPAEVGAMAMDARIARELGADGLVVGALTPDGAVDREAMLQVLNEGRLPATFHRAFELISDKAGGLDQVASLPYVERVLTSGGAANPETAVDVLRDMISQKRLEIMVGAGVTRANAGFILRETRTTALHTATAVRDPSLPTATVSAALVAEMRQIVEGGASHV
ncbi:MAG TPA: copper homeostasis protein CutC [Symbiobacteriaceae bacterium]|nr:copper homeostasis protein CutC [Symbiobacteriaceae bacterium]